MENDIEKDKLVAEFLGLYVLEGISNSGEKYYYYNNAELQDYEALPDFRHSWDDLMPVLEKISTIKCGFGRFNCRIAFLSREPYCRIESKAKSFRNSTINHETLIKATYETVVEFIKWYTEFVK